MQSMEHLGILEINFSGDLFDNLNVATYTLQKLKEYVKTLKKYLIIYPLIHPFSLHCEKQ